jgi:hypothetical protein
MEAEPNRLKARLEKQSSNKPVLRKFLKKRKKFCQQENMHYIQKTEKKDT